MPEVKRSGMLVTPGEKIGVIEEFMPGLGTHEVDGSIFAKVVGRVLMDLISKRVSISPLAHGGVLPQAGSLVTGNITSVQEFTAGLRIFRIEAKLLSGFFNGVLHVSDANIGYVDSMFDVCRLGDIMRAKVISDMNGTYHLTTKSRELGVIYAFCSKCGSILRQRKAEMVCDDCGNAEKRKAALDYGKGEI